MRGQITVCYYFTEICIYIFSDGNFLHDEKVIPFGVGKRECIGRTLAEKQLFIFVAGLLQQFHFRPVPGTVLPSYIDIFPRIAMLRTAPDFKVILTKRSQEPEESY